MAQSAASGAKAGLALVLAVLVEWVPEASGSPDGALLIAEALVWMVKRCPHLITTGMADFLYQ